MPDLVTRLFNAVVCRSRRFCKRVDLARAMELFATALFALAPLALRAAGSTNAPAEDWAWLDNGQVRLGVVKSSGAGIGWFSMSGSSRNLLNHFDRGRLIQQSYYGNPDGSTWNGRPWRWNPVQGGDWKGNPARLLELSSGTNQLYAKSIARNWGGCAEIPEVTFDEWISLAGKIARARFRMSYRGSIVHQETDHEIPAFFAEPDLKTLVLYSGDQPWTSAPASRSVPGWPNESRRMTEGWAAYVDRDDFGIGAFVPVANRLTCYHFGGDDSSKGACSYFAPLTKFGITPDKVFEYDVYLTAGKTDEIRAAFRGIHDRQEEPAADGAGSVRH
jgi:hypothetical protein